MLSLLPKLFYGLSWDLSSSGWIVITFVKIVLNFEHVPAKLCTSNQPQMYFLFSAD